MFPFCKSAWLCSSLARHQEACCFLLPMELCSLSNTETGISLLQKIFTPRNRPWCFCFVFSGQMFRISAVIPAVHFVKTRAFMSACGQNCQPTSYEHLLMDEWYLAVLISGVGSNAALAEVAGSSCWTTCGRCRLLEAGRALMMGEAAVIPADVCSTSPSPLLRYEENRKHQAGVGGAERNCVCRQLLVGTLQAVTVSKFRTH